MFIFIRFSFTFFKINLRKLKKIYFFDFKDLYFIYLIFTLKLKKEIKFEE
jgi:hypothetical protein